MKKEGSTYKWPSEVEESWESKDHIIAPVILNQRELFVLSAKDMNKIKLYFQGKKNIPTFCWTEIIGHNDYSKIWNLDLRYLV